MTLEECVANEKTEIVNIDGWTFYQNTYLQGHPSWAIFFGKKMATIYPIDEGFKCIIKDENWLGKSSKVLCECVKNTLTEAMKFCEDFGLS